MIINKRKVDTSAVTRNSLALLIFPLTKGRKFLIRAISISLPEYFSHVRPQTAHKRGPVPDSYEGACGSRPRPSSISFYAFGNADRNNRAINKSTNKYGISRITSLKMDIIDSLTLIYFFIVCRLLSLLLVLSNFFGLHDCIVKFFSSERSIPEFLQLIEQFIGMFLFISFILFLISASNIIAK